MHDAYEAATAAFDAEAIASQRADLLRGIAAALRRILLSGVEVIEW